MSDDSFPGGGAGRPRAIAWTRGEGGLIGRYEDSGYEDPPYIARRADGQVIQMPDLLYFVAEELDGRRGYEEVAERVSQKLGRQIAPGDAQMLVEKKLRPLSVVAALRASSRRCRSSTRCSR